MVEAEPGAGGATPAELAGSSMTKPAHRRALHSRSAACVHPAGLPVSPFHSASMLAWLKEEVVQRLLVHVADLSREARGPFSWPTGYAVIN